MKFRIEKDTMGEVQVPADKYWGAQTERSRNNFKIGPSASMPKEIIEGFAFLKKAAAFTNCDLGVLSTEKRDLIATVCDEIIAAKLTEEFPLVIWQTGSGTQSNMNVNEVIANRAIELLGGQKGDYSLVHPLNHVNLSQSTNDVYPTALRIAAIRLLQPLSESCAQLQGSLQKKEAEFAGILKLGRTEMQDAVPITLGQEFSAWAEAIARDRWRLYKVEERLREVNLGGTAVGTGLNAERKYVFGVVEHLRSLTGIGLARDENMIDPTQNADVFVEVSGLLKACASTLIKISNDLRLLASGPRGGIGEICLPDLQAGSSIMPGKVNPVIPEMVAQIGYQTIARDLAITLAAQGGQLELNAFLPLIAANLLPAMEELTHAMRLFANRCIDGIEVDSDRCRFHLENSVALITALSPLIGYDRAAEIAKQALKDRSPVKKALLDSGLFTLTELDTLLRPEALTRPGMIKKPSTPKAKEALP